MDSQEEILMNILADNPIVAIYNAEPTWQAGFLTVGIYLLKVILGTAWIFIRTLLLAIVWLINTLVAPYFPSMSLPEPENWPAAFMKGLSKLKNLPVISDSRFMIPFLIGLAILYIVLSFNTERCRQILLRFEAQFGTAKFPGTPTVNYSPGKAPVVPGGEVALVQPPWYFRIISISSFIVGLVSRINRRIIDFFTSQGLKKTFVAIIGLVLSYWAWHWLGDPMTILVEKNYDEWKEFPSAVRLSLYRAASWQFLMSAVYTLYVLYAYGFKTFFSVVSSMSVLFIAYLAKIYAFIDNESPEYQQAINVEPRAALSGDESPWMYIVGLFVVLPFVSVFSVMASQAYEKRLLDPRGPIKKAFLAVLMWIPNLIAGLMSVVKYYLSSLSKLIGSPTVESPGTSEVASALPESSEPKVSTINFHPETASTPGTPSGLASKSPISISSSSSSNSSNAPVTPSPASSTSKTREKVPSPIIVPDKPVSPGLESSSSSASTVFFDALSSVQEEVQTIKRSFNLRGSRIEDFFVKNWVAFVVLLLLMAAFFVPFISQILYNLVLLVLRFAAYLMTFVGNTLDSISNSLEAALPSLEPAVRVMPDGTFPAKSAPQAPISPASPQHSTTPFTKGVLVPSTPSKFGYVWASLISYYTATSVFLEGVLGKAMTNCVLLGASSLVFWVRRSIKRVSGSALLTKLLVWLLPSLLLYQVCTYLKEFEIFRALLEDSYGYIFAFISLAFIRTYTTIAHGRPSGPPNTSDITRPSKVEYKPSDVTVIIPTRGYHLPEGPVVGDTIPDRAARKIFANSLRSIVANQPAEVILATTGLDAHQRMNLWATRFGTQLVKVTSILESEANLRRQFLKATGAARTDIVCYAHSNVQWSPTFLRDALAPFNDPDVGLVGVPVDIRRKNTRKDNRVYFNPCQFREAALKPVAGKGRPSYAKYLEYAPFRIMNLCNYALHDFGVTYGLLSYLEKNYYARFNHSNHSTSTFDSGALSLVSAKTALIRTSILQSTSFRFTFPHEKIAWGFSPLRGGMRSDAAEYITRKVREMGYQSAFISTTSTLVTYEFQNRGLLHYARLLSARYSSLYRSNLASLQTSIWLTHLWTAYTMFAALLNIPLIIDGGLAALLWWNGHQGFFWALVVFLLSYRVWVLWPHGKEDSEADWRYVPLGVVIYYLDGVVQVLGLLNAIYPLAEREEWGVNVRYKGQWDDNTGTVR